jgi:putative NADPH-quinone reductase
MSKYLIVYAHPNHEGHCGYLLKRVLEKLEQNKADREIIDLYAQRADEHSNAEERAVNLYNSLVDDNKE